MDVVSFEEDRVLAVRRWNGDNEVLTVFNFNNRAGRPIPNIPAGRWRKCFDSADSRWMGQGTTAPDFIGGGPNSGLTLQPFSVLLFEKETQD